MRTKVRGRFVVALGAALALWATCPVKPAVVTGRSMDPTLRDGQAVLIDRWHYRQHAIQRGDIIAFRGDGMVQVKRVYALAGERVWEVHYDDSDSVFLADPRHLEETRRLLSGMGSPARLVERGVPPGTLYVLGDGGNASMDSRYYGPIPCSAVLGRIRTNAHGEVETRAAAERATLWVTRRS